MTLAALISVVIVLVIIGVVLYLIENYIPMSPPIAIVIRVLVVLACALVVLACALYLLQRFGVAGQ